jgi:hypothetical protein
VTEVPAPNDGSTRPKRSPKPNNKYRPELCGEQVEDKEEHQKVKILIKMIPFALEGERRA